MNKKIFAVIKSFKSWLRDEIVTLDFSEWWILTVSIFLLVIVIFTKVINVVLPDNFVMEFFFAVLTAIVSSFVYIWLEDDRADTLLKMRVLKKGKSLEKLNDLECDLDDRKQELLSRLKKEPVGSLSIK
jgi:hypothetical protein